MVDVLRLHDGVVLEVGGLITSFVEGVAFGGKGSETVGLSEDDLGLDTLHVSRVSYWREGHVRGLGVVAYQGFAFGVLWLG